MTNTEDPTALTVLNEILTWSADRPVWQRDALRRLVTTGDLTDDDLQQLTEICKSVHGLSAPQTAIPLSKSHLPVADARRGAVQLLSILHQRGVNALAENQTLKFGPNLTVVYGDNGAGKTGYIRILKNACRARGTETILGNVVSGLAPPPPELSVKYQAANAVGPLEWTGGPNEDPIGRVSVFDTKCATVYLTEKTDVAFRPFGLDLFDKLVRACNAVKTCLDAEQKAIGVNAPWAFQIPEGTAAATAIANLTSLTDTEKLKRLASLSAADQERQAFLTKTLADLQANDPVKLAQQLTLRSDRIHAFAQLLSEIEASFSRAGIERIFEAQAAARSKADIAQKLRGATFSPDLLAGTGSEEWTHMWSVAAEFSEKKAYPGRAFPFTEAHARCVLCQQELDPASAKRLQQFAGFIISTAEQDLKKARDEFAVAHRRLEEWQLTGTSLNQSIQEINIESESLAKEVAGHMESIESVRQSALEALRSRQGRKPDTPEDKPLSGMVRALANQLKERAKALQDQVDAKQKQQFASELQELVGRATLAQNLGAVLAEVEKKKRVAAYGLCLNDTKTQTITAKSTSVTRAAVTQRLVSSFRDELASLRFNKIEVELKEAGGAQGNLYHKLVLKRAPGVELPKVVSEGEARCLSIAAFFAELSTADDRSGIVFDDPVSSLDYKWRDDVARRLVKEASSRQVIVFTHDIVFLLLLQKFSDEQSVGRVDQHVRKLANGAGVCEEELPWPALSVKKRIGHLNKEWQVADKLFRTGQQSAYEKEASVLYGLLREAWERALEEVLLGKVVERFRSSVQTQQIMTISDIKPQDCETLEAGMTKCSAWLPGHDQAAAARADMPEPGELKKDIEALENWVSDINKRRQQKT